MKAMLSKLMEKADLIQTASGFELTHNGDGELCDSESGDRWVFNDHEVEVGTGGLVILPHPNDEEDNMLVYFLMVRSIAPEDLVD